MRTLIAILLAFSLAATAGAGQHRSYKAKRDFKLEHPCPGTGKSRGACPGWVIDHIKPLSCGGADSPENMQWQTIEEGKAKDRWERRGCDFQQLGE